MPTFTVTCPGCSKSLKVPASKAGRWIQCPGCNMEFAALDDSDDPPVGDAGSYPSPARRIPAVGLTIAGGLLFLVLMTGLLVYAKNRPHPDARPPDIAQAPRPDNFEQARAAEKANREKDGAAIATTLLTGFLMVVGAIIAYIVFVILLVAWVARDARRRGIDGAAIWAILVMLTGVVGLLIYVASRPNGMMVVCDRCHGQRLEYLRICPHCRHQPRRSKRTLLLA